ncbi:MAG: nitronate monooxygenase [Saprospiraceae bacterium]
MDMQQFDQHLRLPLIASPMFLVSGTEMVVECCKQHIVGTFPSVNQRTTAGFEDWVLRIKAELANYNETSLSPAAPFGVNLVVHKTNPRWKDDLKVCVKHEVPLIITSLGAAPEVVEAIHAYGGLVFHDVTNPYHARKAAAIGVDGIIAVCGGAGGHSGATNPFALVGEIRAFFDKTLILGGAISTGKDIAAALQMGADYAYMGTRFINVQESLAPREYQEMIIAADSSQILYTPGVTGVPANFLKPSLLAAGFDLAQLSNPITINYGEKLKPPKEGSKTWVDTWSAGHGVGVIHDIPTIKALVDRLENEFQTAIKATYSKSQKYTR